MTPPAVPDDTRRAPVHAWTYGIAAGDRRVLRQALRRAGVAPAMRVARNLDALRRAVRESHVDLVVCGHEPGVADGLATLQAVRQVTAAVAVVVLARGGDEDAAVDAMKAGATDYLPWPQATTSLRQALFDAVASSPSLPLGRPTARFEHLLDQLDIGTFRVLADGTFIEANDAMRRLLREESVDALLRAPGPRGVMRAERRRQLLDAIMAAGVVRAARERLTFHDGSSIVVEGDARALADERGRFVSLDGSMYDVTAREDAAARVDFQAMLLDQLRHVVVATGPDFRVLYWNRHAQELLQRSADEVIGGDVARALGVDNPDVVRAMVDASLLTDGHWAGVLAGHRRDGTPVILQARGTRLDADGRHLGYLGTMIDITEHRQLECELETTLAVRDRLLREVHSRVRRNLHVVSRILHLEQLRAGDPALAELFRDSEQRLRAIALIHDWLSPADGRSLVNMRDYLAHLLDGLRATANVTNAVQVILHADALSLGLDVAVRLGLIVNELVTNALKHAFVDGRTGTVSVGLRCAGPGGMILDVSDDGVGLPPTVDAGQTSTLGLQLVRNLAAGMQAELRIVRDRGTHVQIERVAPCVQIVP